VNSSPGIFDDIESRARSQSNDGDIAAPRLSPSSTSPHGIPLREQSEIIAGAIADLDKLKRNGMDPVRFGRGVKIGDKWVPHRANPKHKPPLIVKEYLDHEGRPQQRREYRHLALQRYSRSRIPGVPSDETRIRHGVRP